MEVAIADKAATNKRAINLLLAMTAVKFVDCPCHAHNLCKPGDELTKATPNANAFRKYFNEGILFRGKMFALVKKVFGVSPLVAVGVRWYIIWEQCNQINALEFKKF